MFNAPKETGRADLVLRRNQLWLSFYKNTSGKQDPEEYSLEMRILFIDWFVDSYRTKLRLFCTDIIQILSKVYKQLKVGERDDDATFIA